MPRFEPFTGVRYNPEAVSLDAVVAPPYDVIGPEQRHQLEARSPYNVVHVDLSRDEPERDRYTAAGCRFDEWLAHQILLADPEPSFYVYRMGYRDEGGRLRQTSGVIGALELSVPGQGDVLPHERTMPKPKDDRLSILRACRANLSPIWVVSLAGGLSDLCELPGAPVARCTDDEGVHHRLWRIAQPGVVQAIGEAVASAPVVIADGHHRYETALAYRDERRAATGGAAGDYDFLMTYVVELAEEQLSIRPIHRLVAGLPEGFDLRAALSEAFELFDAGPPSESLTARMADADALALVLPGRAWLLRPRVQDDAETDAARLDAVLAGLPPHELSFHHSAEHVAALVEKGEAQAGLLLRPASVGQIAAAARAGRRLPEKTTFFYPKPQTGLVFRRLAEEGARV